MGEFAGAVRERLRAARADVETAHRSEDAFEVSVACDVLEDVQRVAREHGVGLRCEVSSGGPR